MHNKIIALFHEHMLKFKKCVMRYEFTDSWNRLNKSHYC